MKIALASEQDLKRANDLANLLDCVCPTRAFDRPRFPCTDDEEGAPFDLENSEDLRALYGQLRALHSGLHRIVWGYMVIRDNALDTSLSHVDLKPEIRAAIAAYTPTTETAVTATLSTPT